MLPSLIEIAGVWFLAACAAELIAVFAEQAAAARSPEDEKPRGGFGALALGAAALLTPGLLLMHGYFVTEGADVTVRMLALGAPLGAVIAGSLLGAVFGALARGAAPTMRLVAPWLAGGALVLTFYAAMPSIAALVAAIQNDGVLILPVQV